MALENYLPPNYTELDDNGRYAVAANVITITGLTRNEDAYVYADKGAAHFGDFTHYFEWTGSGAGSTTSGVYCPWGVSNVVDDGNGLRLASAQALLFFVLWDGALWDVYLDNEELYPAGRDSCVNLAQQTYYCAAVRSGATIELRIYTSAADRAADQNRVDTLSLAVDAARTYQYIFAVNSWNSTNANTCSGTVANLDLHEAGIRIPRSTGLMTPYVV